MDIVEIQRKVEPILKNNGVERASLFGSVARGTAHEGSDVDMLVRFKHPLGLIAFSRMVNELSQSLNREVDLVTEESLNPHLRPYVVKDAQVIYEAR